MSLNPLPITHTLSILLSDSTWPFEFFTPLSNLATELLFNSSNIGHNLDKGAGSNVGVSVSFTIEISPVLVLGALAVIILGPFVLIYLGAKWCCKPCRRRFGRDRPSQRRWHRLSLGDWSFEMGGGVGIGDG